MSMDDFFLKHDVMKDKESDEVGPKARPVDSDSEASDQESNSTSFASAWDPNGPWKEKGVMKELGKRLANTPSQNVGPKGVLNDYKEYQRQKAEERERNELLRKATIERITKGYIVPPIATTKAQTSNQIEEEGSDDDVFDDPNDDFLEQYRKIRLQELKSLHSRYVDPLEFVDKVNTVEPGTTTIVHLFEEFLPECQEVNNQMNQLAQKYTHIQFLAMKASASDSSIDSTDLPIFAIYRNREMVVSILDVVNKLGSEITFDNIEWLLDQYVKLSSK